MWWLYIQSVWWLYIQSVWWLYIQAVWWLYIQSVCWCCCCAGQLCFLSFSFKCVFCLCVLTDTKKPMQLIDWSIHNSFHILSSHRSLASCSNFHDSLVSLRSSNSCLHLLRRFPMTSIILYTFPSVTCFRRQFQLKLWPIRLSFLVFIACRILLSLTPYDTSQCFKWSVQLIFSSLSSTTSQNYPAISELFTKCLTWSNIQTSVLVESLLNRSFISRQCNKCMARCK